MEVRQIYSSRHRWSACSVKRIHGNCKNLTTFIKIEGKSSKDKIKCNFCKKLGHKEKDCFTKITTNMQARQIQQLRSLTLLNLPRTVLLMIRLTILRISIISTRINQCIKILNISAADQAVLLDKVTGCALCTDYTGKHQS